MAATSRSQDPHIEPFPIASQFEELLRTLRSEPWRFRFFQAVRLLEAMQPGAESTGEAVRPSLEPVLFAVNPTLAFPASEIQHIDFAVRPPRMYVNFFGLQGAGGVLPLVYTEELQRKGTTPLSEFFDVLNHRFISFFYRAWKRYKLPVATASFRDKALCLVGLGTTGLSQRTSVVDDSWVFYCGLVAAQARSAVALEQVLEDYFAVPVELEQFAGGWRRLSPPYQCIFGRDSESESLGAGVVAGDVVWDRQTRVRVRLGPLSLEQYHEFLPGRNGYKRLRDMTRFFSRDQLDFEVQLILDRSEVQGCRAGSGNAFQLGWTTWIKTKDRFPRNPDETILDPAIADEFDLQ
jgi:type VI secretion system protein ImpH